MGKIMITMMDKDGKFRSKEVSAAKMVESFDAMEKEVKEAMQELRESNKETEEN